MLKLEAAAKTNNVTLIGGQGFIGRALSLRLQSLGQPVWIPEKNDPQLFEKNLGKVFYCAGLTADYLQRPFATVEAHVNLLSDILARAKWNHLVYLSSTRVYDGLSGLLDEGVDLHVNPNNPRHLYDLSKLMGESLCLQTQRASVARLACVYQDEQDADGFLPRLLRQALAQQTQRLVVDSSAQAARDYVHLADVVDALLALSERHALGIFNVASGENISNQAIFSVLEKVCGLSVVCTQAHGSANSSSVNIAKMQTNFGWRPKKVLPTIEAILNAKVSQHVKHNR
jgi:UDP-glucose 4-epimerase